MNGTLAHALKIEASGRKGLAEEKTRDQVYCKIKGMDIK